MSKRSRSRQGRLLYTALLLWAGVPAWGAPPAAVPEPQKEYWTRVEKRDWDAAIASAQQLLAAARAANAPPDKIANALSLVGNAQLAKKDFVAAEATFTEALKLIEPVVRGADARLIDPLQGTGFALAGQEKHAQAVDYMEKALAISHRSEGLFDLDQQELLLRLATSRTALGEPEAAEGHMRYLQRVGEHVFGAGDPRMAPLMCRIGNWYSDRGQLMEARELYRGALGIVEKKVGKNDLATVQPLRELAQSYIREIYLSSYGVRTQDKFAASPDPSAGDQAQAINPRFLGADGEKALLRALAVLETNRATGDPAVLIDTLLQTGDWFQMKQQPERAISYYQRVVSTAATVPTMTSVEKDALLGFPVQVYYPTPQLATRNLTRPASEVVDKFVQVEFTVLPDGTVKDVRVVDQDGSSRQASQTLEAIRDARYRPKFVQGQPVQTQAVRYRQVFKQRKDKDSE